ncbi:type II secretion protein F [Paenibacillus sp. GCM10027627]|uniref:type II secretion protein F n=1 Tax=unclassified Paenibacillus TaxID=185978 RepID=UPI0036322506
MAAVMAILFTSIWFYLIGTASFLPSRNLAVRKGKGQKLSMERRFLEAPFLALLERFCKWDFVQQYLNEYHMKLFILNGMAWTIEKTKREAAVSAGYGYFAGMALSWLSWLSGETLLLGAALLGCTGLGARGFVRAGQLLNKRRGKIIAVLPQMMSQLMLLVGAGETVQGAFARCLAGKEGSEHPLYKEWQASVLSLRNGQSFSETLERFNRHCALQEASLFSTVLLLNYRKGGDQFILSVRELSYSLWEKRKGLARVRGEEASSKLVFPLAVILFTMLALVAAPAVLSMS